jgi:Fe-S cluster biogenesis protein NfuA
VIKNGAGAGTVVSNPGGIDCGTTCSASFAGGAAVGLTAIPESGSTFAGWSGACTGGGACTVTMSQAQNATATFARQAVTLTVINRTKDLGRVSSNPAGISCGRTCSLTGPSGTVVTLTATPAARAVFVGWSGACTGTGVCSVTLTQAKSVTATFKKQDRR